MQDGNPDAPVREIVASLSKYRIPLGLVDDVFENVRQYLKNMHVYDPSKSVDVDFIVGAMNWNPLSEHPASGERVLVALENGQIRESVYDNDMFNALFPEDIASIGVKIKILAWLPLNPS